MQIIPVLDLLDGHVVRGVGGQRETYRPIESDLVAGANPLEIATAFRDQFGLSRLYVADLNAIQNQALDVATITALVEAGFDLMVDAGLTDHQGAGQLLDLGATSVIAGLETLYGPEALAVLCQRHGSERIMFSLDLQAGQPLTPTSNWGHCDAASLAAQAVTCGAQRMIVLDLSGVGTNCGVGTLELCGQLRRRYPELELITGGGVRGVDDLLTLRDQGLDGVLVASALHDGTLTPADTENISAGS